MIQAIRLKMYLVGYLIVPYMIAYVIALKLKKIRCKYLKNNVILVESKIKF